MPCNSDYMNPNMQQEEHQRAAILLVYVMRSTKQTVQKWMLEEARDEYAREREPFR